MKIGILTFHRALNYGAVLQCYALCKTLTRMGHNVEVIDYRSKGVERSRYFFSKKSFLNSKGIIGKIRYIVSSILLIRSRIVTSRKFDDFISREIQLSAKVNNTNDIPTYYDIIIFGSDQIWNPEIVDGLDSVYYGRFDKNRSRFITYAASLGRIELISNKYKKDFGEYVRRYDSVSVREKLLRDFLKEKYSIDADIVCDPSLLLKKESYESIAIRPKEDNYVLLFEQTGDINTYSLAKDIANQIGSNVIRIGAETNPLHRYPCKNFPEVSPVEFLGYIKYAKCIVTTSFHVTSFSVIMQKDFYTIKRENNNDRARTLLVFLGLEERLVDTKKSLLFSEVNYEGVDKKMENYIKKSLEYLMKGIAG